jgi:effector-binding domain-containing protein
MKFLKYLLLVIVGIIGIYVVTALLSDKVSEVVVSKEIDAEIDVVFDVANDFNHYVKWNEWARMDPASTFEVEGAGNVGDMYKWEGPEIGTGSLTKVAVEENKSIHNHMVFVAPWQSEGEDLWAFETKDGKTVITWTTQSEAPWYMRPMMSMMLGGTMEIGLNNMAEYIAEMPEPAKAEIIIENINDMYYLGVRNQIATSELAQTLGESYGKLSAFCTENSVEMAGMPLAIYYTWENDSTDMIAAFPVSEEIEGTEGIEYGVISASKAVTAIHYGSYDSSEMTHMAMGAYIEENGFEISGPVFEIYLNDPETVSEAEIQTKIIYPIASADEME